jgi:uncharacterized OsmC-like protein
MTRLDLWKKRISEQKCSGLTKKTWCIQQGINYHTMQYWAAIINKASHEKENLTFKELSTPKTSSLKIRWQHITIEIDADFDESTLKRFLKVLS